MAELGFMQDLQAQVNSYLTTYCEKHAGADPDGLLASAVRYCLLGGGKRLRPILVLASCRAAGGTEADSLPPAAAIEMIHTFSLIHDDLPAMDDDDLRRGRPTCHIKYESEAVAILAGDALATLPYLLIHREVRDPALAAGLVAELSEATMKMILGQVYDTEGAFPAPVTDPAERLRLLHDNKTGALIRCACRMGALVAAADPGVMAAITRYGEAIGLMFQIVDDILDETQSTEHMGKRTHKDADKDKLTYPTVHGLDASRTMVADLEQQAARALDSLGNARDTSQLRALAAYLASRTR